MHAGFDARPTESWHVSLAAAESYGGRSILPFQLRDDMLGVFAHTVGVRIEINESAPELVVLVRERPAKAPERYLKELDGLVLLGGCRLDDLRSVGEDPQAGRDRPVFAQS